MCVCVFFFFVWGAATTVSCGAGPGQYAVDEGGKGPAVAQAMLSGKEEADVSFAVRLKQVGIAL